MCSGRASKKRVSLQVYAYITHMLPSVPLQHVISNVLYFCFQARLMSCSSVNETNKCAQPKILCTQTKRQLCFSCLKTFCWYFKVCHVSVTDCIVVDCNMSSFHGDIMYNVLLSIILYDIISTRVKTRLSEYLRNKLFLFVTSTANQISRCNQ